MFDCIVITAANDAQAKGYRAQVKGRDNVLVISDPGGRRVGSLGATVNLLRRLKLSGKVLVCHSGGDARRTPGYAAMGKAFVPMRDGRSLFEHIVESMAKLPLPKAGGILVTSGDVLLTFDCDATEFSRPGVTGVAYPDGPFQAQRHGVYVTGLKEDVVGGKRGCTPVSDFLQKPKVKRGRFLIDTGIMHFDWETAEKMAKLPVAGDIYEEFPKLLLEGFAPFKVSVVPDCEFFHIGSSRELLKLLGGKPVKSEGTGRAKVRGRVLVDAVQAPIESLGGDNIVTNVPASYGPVNLKKGECLTSLPLKTGEWYHLHYRIDDTFKEDGLWDKHDLGVKMRQVAHRRLMALKGPVK